MSLTTRAISEGPAVVEWNGLNFYTTDTINLTPNIALREMISSYYGRVDSRVTDKSFALSFTPIGMMADNAAKYFPWGAADVGKLLMPETDLPIVIWTSAGEKITIPAGMIMQPPQLILGTDRGPMGQMQMMGLSDIAIADAAANAHYKIETAAITAHTLNPDEAPTPAYVAELGEGGGADEIDSEEGFVFDLGATVVPRMVNRYGTFQLKLTGLTPSVAFAPFGQSEAEVMDLVNIQGASAAKLGASNKLGKKLTIKPAEAEAKGITIVFADCQVQSGSMLFGMEDPRHGQYAFIPSVGFSGGAPTALYTITFPTFGGGGEE